MSIHALLGKPGAGKSYHAIQIIHETLKSGRAVVTNMPVNKKYSFFAEQIEKGNLEIYPSSSNAPEGDTMHFGHLDGWRTFIDKEKKYHRDISKDGEEEELIGPMIIVDESAYTFGDMIRQRRRGQLAGQFDKLQEFFKVHRHSLIDINLCYHDHTQTDGETKPLIDRWHAVVNTSEMTGKNTYTIKTSAKGYSTGNVYISKKSGTFKKKYFEMYDSYSEGSGKSKKGKKKETGLLKSRPIWLRWWFLLVVVLLLLLPFLLFKTSSGIKGVVTPDEKSKSFGSTGEVQQQPVTTLDLIKPDVLTVTDQTEWAPPFSKKAEELGLPQPSIPFVGYDNENIFFRSGQIVNRDIDITASRVQILVVKPCAISLLVGEAESEEIISYRCQRGY